jgi:peptidyl-prolyl cis-trans isomerase B (cyclophilin B)
LKHYCTVTFLRDSELPANKKPVALHWYNPYIAVAIDKKDKEKLSQHGPGCMMPSTGDAAPNMVPGSSIRDTEGVELSGHWAVPVGVNHYESPITEQFNRGFSEKNRKIHAVWSHVHPMCTESSLVKCEDGKREKIFTAHISTKNENGPEIERIENILSKDGIKLEAGKNYVLEATYDNKTKDEIDSMVALGIFFEDDKFKKPDWKQMAAAAAAASSLVPSNGTSGVFCGIKGGSCETASASAAGSSAPASTGMSNPADYGGSDRFALFNPATDGPVLSEKKSVEMLTSAGPIHIEIDPSLAPQTATQIYKYMKNGSFNNTEIYRYEPSFVLQTSSAENKVAGTPPMSSQLYEQLRRLPLEVDAQKSGRVVHKKWALSMGHYTAPDSGVSSFSIMLDDAPHLDCLYTIFGHVIPDEVTLQTIKNATENWNKDKLPYILSAHDYTTTKADSNEATHFEAKK